MLRLQRYCQNADADDRDAAGDTEDEESEECDSDDDSVAYRDVTSDSGTNRKLDCVRNFSAPRVCGLEFEALRQTGSTTLAL
jgi:hypothetical protein